ncbi:hypothetical protein, partial [Heyndrickxia sporothermodurans]|uniref:hypothetical protein n=1 Tax=Heyndrickxia sporothermodurans TaxID=46224 RepID=UPI001F4331D5
NFILSEVILIFIQKIIKAGEILLVVKIHRLFHLRGGFCPSLFSICHGYCFQWFIYPNLMDAGRSRQPTLYEVL